MKIAVLGGHYLKNLCRPENVWSCNLPLTIDPRADNSVQRLLADRCPFEPDLVLFSDQGCIPMLTGFEDLNIPTAAYLIDTHLSYDWHRHFAGLFDLVFVAQQNAAASLGKYHQHCRWTPLFSRHGDLHQHIEKLDDVVFVGTVNSKRNSERVRFLDEFSQQMPLQVRSGDYRDHFAAARIILNQSVRNDVNFRVFEALATGSLLLTDAVGNGLEQLFENGRHLVTYRKGDVNDAIAKARYYLDHPQEREQIAESGHVLVCSRHTLVVRSGELVQEMVELRNRMSVCAENVAVDRRFVKKLAAGRTYMAIALLMLDLETLHGDGSYGQRSYWYKELAELVFKKVLSENQADDRIIKDLALLAFLQGDLEKASTYSRIALLDNPDDIELLLLTARIAGLRGDTRAGTVLYNKAVALIQQALQQSGDQLWCEYLATEARFCKQTL